MKTVYVKTDPEFGEFWGRNRWVNLGGLEAWLPDSEYDVQRAVILPHSSRNRISNSAAIYMQTDELEVFCLEVLAKLMGLGSMDELITVLEVARYPFTNPQLIELLGETMDVHPVEMDHIGSALEEYMQRWQEPEEPEPKPERADPFEFGDDDIPF